MTKTSLVKIIPEAREEFLTPFSSIFDRFLSQTFPDFSQEFGIDIQKMNSFPKCNIEDQPEKLIIEAEIPGLSKEDVKIIIKNNMLSIKGEKKKITEESNEDKKFILKELKHSSFMRSFKLNDNLDLDSIDASFENGILKINIPKKDPVKDTFTEIKIT
jgi:HSP20 family protein